MRQPASSLETILLARFDQPYGFDIFSAQAHVDIYGGCNLLIADRSKTKKDLRTFSRSTEFTV